MCVGKEKTGCKIGSNHKTTLLVAKEVERGIFRRGGDIIKGNTTKYGKRPYSSRAK